MLSHKNVTLSIAVLVALSAAVAADGHEEPQEGTRSLNPCELSQDTCDAVAGAYDATSELLGAHKYDGLEGVLEATLDPKPHNDAVWSFVRVGEDTVTNAQTVETPNVVSAVHLTPSVPLLVLLDEGEALLRLPDAEPTGRALLAEVQTEPATNEVNEAVTALPFDPRDALKAFLHDLGTFTLPELPEPKAHVAQKVEASSAADLPPARTAKAPEPVAEAVRPAHHEVLQLTDLDLTPVATPTADATARNPVLAPLAGMVQLLPPVDRTTLAAAAAAVLSILLLAPPLYHRLHRHQLLEHTARAKLYELVSARPGIHIEELARSSGCSRSTAVYHLRLLARNGYVLAVGSAKSVHYYPNNGHQDPTEREQRALLSSPRTRAIADLVAAQPGINRNDLSGTVGVSPSTLSWHLGRLLERGLIEDRLTPTGRALYPSARLAELLRPWSAGSPMPSPAAAVSEGEQQHAPAPTLPA